LQVRKKKLAHSSLLALTKRLTYIDFGWSSDIIGTISIGAEMKTALQQEGDEETSDDKETKTDAKGKKVLSPEEKKKKDEEERKQSEERAKVREARGAFHSLLLSASILYGSLKLTFILVAMKYKNWRPS
jgi:hypothetical protein